MGKLTEEYVKSLFLEHGIYWCEESEYVGISNPVIALNSEGYIVMVRVSDLRRNYGVRPFYKSNPYTIDNIKLWCEKNTEDIRLVDGQKYTDAKTKLEFECLKCGSIYEATWDDVHSKRGCPYCRGMRVNHTNSIFNLRPDLVKYFKDIKDSKNRTIGSSNIVNLVCPSCSYEKTMSPSDLVNRGFSCNNCNPDYRVTRSNEVYSSIQADRNKVKWKNKTTYLYVISMFKNDEYFYKIGIGHKGANKRFSDRVNVAYDFEILYEEKMSLYDGIKVEHILHDSFEEYSYLPKIKFKGYTECFSEIDLDKIKMIINDYKE
jgi:Zn finger protein HypA/HybF involved in hydrogenase expression